MLVDCLIHGTKEMVIVQLVSPTPPPFLLVPFSVIQSVTRTFQSDGLSRKGALLWNELVAQIHIPIIMGLLDASCQVRTFYSLVTTPIIIVMFLGSEFLCFFYS